MNLSPSQIEQIIGEVVRRLRALQPAPVANANELVLTDAVVSVGLLAGRLTNVRKLVVRPKAVVTPAVRDELKKHGVTLERRFAAASVGRVRLLLAATNEAASQELRRAAIADGERLESQATQSLGGTLTELTRHATSRKLPALLLAAEPFAATVEANRVSGLRTVMIEREEQVQQAAAEVKANVFVIAAGKLNSAQLRRIADAIAAAGE